MKKLTTNTTASVSYGASTGYVCMLSSTCTRIPYAPRYYAQSHAETAFARFNRTFGSGLWAKQEESQEREASLACQLLNRMLEQGCPQSCPVS
jgi:hypothetical protein